MVSTPTLTLPTYTDPFIADAVHDRLRRKVGVVGIDLRFDHKATGVQPSGPVPARAVREAETALMIAETAKLFRVDGRGWCVTGFRRLTGDEFSQGQRALLEEAFALWARASRFDGADLSVACSADGSSACEVVLIPSRALRNGTFPLNLLSPNYPICPEITAVLNSFEQALRRELLDREPLPPRVPEVARRPLRAAG